MMKKAIFLDRDGVINKNVKRMTSPEQFEIIEGVPEAIKKINDKGYLVIVVTNQPDISKGFVTFEGMDKIHDKMKALLGRKGAKIDAIYMCPHHPEKGFPGEIAELKIVCDCRKPKPGLLLKAIEEHNIDANKSWMIGDSKTDIVAGQKAGLKTVLITSGGGAGSKQDEEYQDVKADSDCKDLKEAVSLIFR